MRTPIHPLVLAAALGLGAGTALWLCANAAGGDYAWAEPIAPSGSSGVRGASPLLRVARDVQAILAHPLGVAGAGAPVDAAQLHLQGTAIHGGHASALISIGSSASSWWRMGEEHDGVTLREVSPSSVVIVTASGSRTIGLQAAGAATQGQAPPLPLTVPSDGDGG